ncbi:CpsD/CapB family tyrosine-protein kinase [Lacticaseibacillus porcinae]|uniref:CpsD/CapB family tyrosine-protein kinase n=1 Tax=Lacticaseibacillus porcinae TaxID=1123687 RepID=UPI000F7A4A23|nr:CpsD/CapB family tyrosine-protein kinase [Lacticaseibacillus porcinae]
MATNVKDPQATDFDRQVRELRNTIAFHFSNQKSFSLLITSAGEQEGKSAMALALAKSFQTLQKQVLLIDGNFSETRQDSTADVAEHNLFDLILSDDDLDAVTKVAIKQGNGISYLPAGKATTDSAIVLGNPRFAQLLEKAKANYDVVIVDGPAAFGESDVQFIGRVTDTTLFVVPQRQAHQHQLTDAVDALREVGADVLGGVLTV